MVKKDKIKLLILGLIGLAIIFSIQFYNEKYGFNLSEAEIISLKTKNKAANYIANKYNIYCVGEGGQKNEKYEVLHLAFNCNQPLDKTSARQLLIHVTSDFLKVINENEEFKPHMVQYPFDVKNVKVSLFFYQSDYKPTFDPLITVASTYNGKVYYATKSPEDQYGYKNTYEETFEEALKIMQEQQNEGEVQTAIFLPNDGK